MPFPLDERFVLEAESELGARFPDEYRSALMQSNGGEIHWDGAGWFVHPIADTSDRKRLSRTSNHVLRETRVARSRHRFPQNGISIAVDGCGNHLILLMEPGGIPPAVHVWDHEMGSIHRIAEDFAQLAALPPASDD